MLVLLHFFRLGYSPFTLAFLFLLYEAAGVVANLLGGWLATRFGITRMLAVGLSTQIAGFLLLSAVSPDWGARSRSPGWSLAQGVCGVAKDLTKTASKSAIKLTEAEARGEAGQPVQVGRLVHRQQERDEGRGLLPRRPAAGGAGLPARAVGDGRRARPLVLVGVLLSLPPLDGQGQGERTARELFGKNRGINLLAAARVMLFGARDVWFVVGVPVFLYASGWTFTMVGGFLAPGPSATAWCRRWPRCLVRRSATG
jgi:hypothetical protein